MSIRNTPARWEYVAQLLHWVIVALIIVQVILANIAEDLPPIGPKKSRYAGGTSRWASPSWAS